MAYRSGKVTPEIVRKIRYLWDRHGRASTKLAREFNLSKNMAWKIATRRSWAWVDDNKEAVWSRQ